MHVIATAGHVDHGKSALVRALTGTDPDRLEEERRRGLSIRLGYAWTTLPEVGEVAFVDVPGHERFVSTMLSGVGPLPAVLFVVAADDPWMPQAAEHLAALDALGVRHAVVAVTRSDLADPEPAAARAAEQLERTSLCGAPTVAVSSRTGEGLDALRALLGELVRRLPVPDPGADVRLWVDRRFTISGAGTVVTGTLPAGTVARGDRLSTGSGVVRVRGVQRLGASVDSVCGVARVALNLTGDVHSIDRSSALTTTGAYEFTEVVDVRVVGASGRLPDRPMLHVGAVSMAARCRPLTRDRVRGPASDPASDPGSDPGGDPGGGPGRGSGDAVRLRLERPLPLRVGDRALLRDPGSRRVWGVRVLDPLPPALARRGAASERAEVLSGVTGEPDLVSEVVRRGVVDRATLRRIGVPADAVPPHVVQAGRWLMSASRAEEAAHHVVELVGEHNRSDPLAEGLPLTVLAERLGMPTPDLAASAVRAPLRVAGGRVQDATADVLAPEVVRAVEALRQDLADAPFAAPPADRLRELGLDPKRVAVAAKAGRLLRVGPGIVLLSGADRLAVEWLSELPQPFTASQARSRLATSRRVVLPLLEHLDRAGLTRRLPDDRRLVVADA